MVESSGCVHLNPVGLDLQSSLSLELEQIRSAKLNKDFTGPKCVLMHLIICLQDLKPRK